MKENVQFLLTLAALAVACGGESQQDPDGAGGAGGDYCMAAPEPSMVGFQTPIAPGAFPIIVVDHKLLEFAIGPDTLRFAWEGPDLVGKFFTGQTADVAKQDGWDVVTGPSFQAATIKVVGATPMGPPDLAGSSLNFQYAAACTTALASNSCELPPGGMTVFDLIAASDADTLKIGQAETGQVASWTVRNASAVQRPAWPACKVDAGFSATIAALRPTGG